MYVDCEDVSKVFPRDGSPFSHIDMLYNNTTGSAFMFFTNRFSSYNQVRMTLDNMTKTSFVMKWIIYYYTFMPFGLKNNRVMYQRMATILLYDMMNKEVVVCMNDLIVKSKDRESRDQHSKVLLNQSRSTRKLWLNPQKFTSGVTIGKLIGFLVSNIGIEGDPI